MWKHLKAWLKKWIKRYWLGYHADQYLIVIKRAEQKYPQQHPFNVVCPVCGYCCLGHGGVGCVDKPSMCGFDLDGEDLCLKLK